MRRSACDATLSTPSRFRPRPRGFHAGFKFRHARLGLLDLALWGTSASKLAHGLAQLVEMQLVLDLVVEIRKVPGRCRLVTGGLIRRLKHPHVLPDLPNLDEELQRLIDNLRWQRVELLAQFA